MLDVYDPVQARHRAVFWSQLQELLDRRAGRGPVASDVLLVGFGEASLVLLVDVLSEFVDVLVFLELVPGRRLALVELLVEAPSHFIPDGFLLADGHVRQGIVRGLQVVGLNVHSEEPHRLHTANNSDRVDLAQYVLELGRKKGSKVA